MMFSQIADMFVCTGLLFGTCVRQKQRRGLYFKVQFHKSFKNPPFFNHPLFLSRIPFSLACASRLLTVSFVYEDVTKKRISCSGSARVSLRSKMEPAEVAISVRPASLVPAVTALTAVMDLKVDWKRRLVLQRQKGLSLG